MRARERRASKFGRSVAKFATVVNIAQLIPLIVRITATQVVHYRKDRTADRAAGYLSK